MAFGNDVFQTVINLFPLKEALKLHKNSEVHGKRTKERLKHIIEMLEEKREDSNCLDKIIIHQADKAPAGGSGGGTSGGLGNRGNIAQQECLRENTDCRVCKYLKDNSLRGSYPYFKNHLGSSPAGCPNFVSDTCEGRVKLAEAIKLCRRCMDPEVTWSNSHYYDCINNGVAEHECQFSGCSRSIWMCRRHKDDPPPK